MFFSYSEAFLTCWDYRRQKSKASKAFLQSSDVRKKTFNIPFFAFSRSTLLFMLSTHAVTLTKPPMACHGFHTSALWTQHQPVDEKLLGSKSFMRLPTPWTDPSARPNKSLRWMWKLVGSKWKEGAFYFGGKIMNQISEKCIWKKLKGNKILLRTVFC